MALILPKCMFIHIPRTSGTWIRCAIKSCGIETHETGLPEEWGVKVIHHSLDDARKWSDKPTFSSVRNPLTYLQSRWARKSYPPLRKKMDKIPDKFNEFIEAYLEFCPGSVRELYNDYIGWPPLVDVVIRMEDQPSALIGVLKHFGENFDRNLICQEPPRHTSLEKFGELDNRYDKSLMKEVMLKEEILMREFHYTEEGVAVL